MGIFKTIKENKTKNLQKMIDWQNVLLEEPVPKLIMTKQQLLQSTQQRIANDSRILNDCLNILQKTTKPDVFFSRLSLLFEKMKSICEISEFYPPEHADPVAVLNEVTAQKQDLIKQFLITYFTDTFDKAEKMKTNKGKINKYQAFYDSLQEYYDEMNEDNIDYIETKYKAYTRLLKG